MKTELVIDEDLKKYLIEENDRSNNEYHKEWCEKIGVDTFDWQWKFKFENHYGASVIKHQRKFWI